MQTNHPWPGSGERLRRFVSGGGGVAWGLGLLLWRRFELVENTSHAGNATECFDEGDSLALVFQVAGDRHAALHHDGFHSRAAAGALQPPFDGLLQSFVRIGISAEHGSIPS
jgi:hypothetical protein